MTLLEKLQSKCIEDGDCLRWQGSLSLSCGHPKYNDRPVRRIMYELVIGPIPPKKLVTVSCGCHDCVNPDHLKLTTKSEASKRGNSCPTVRVRKAIASAKAHRGKAKLTMEKAREIRATPGTCTELGEKFGVDRTLISLIRRNLAWRELEATPFSGLGAR